MREDYEVLRELALAVWADKDPKGLEVGVIARLDPSSDEAKKFPYTVENHLTAQERYFFELMEERGLVRFVDNGCRVHLTANGQDFCHSVHDEDVWDGIKEYVLDSPFNLEAIKSSAASQQMILKAARGISAEKDFG